MITENVITHKILEKLLQQDEDLQLEYKTENEKRSDIAECIAAMANSAGGFIIFGVEDPSEGQLPPQILGVSNVKKMIDRVHGAAKDCNPSLSSYVSVRSVIWKQKTLVVTKIHNDIPNIANVKGRFLKRRGSHNMVMNFEDFIHYAVDHKILNFETMPVYHANFDDIDIRKVEAYMALRQRKSPRTFNMPPQEFLKSIKCVIEKEDKLVPNYAGLLLFGHEPQLCIPQAEVTCI
ncbi:hypothetical protein TI03_05135, partial [Achromatium sp. WMS1]